MATVKGTLKVNGKPVTTGANVVFIGPDNQRYSSPVKNDGTYLVEKVPVGPVKAVVQNAPLFTGDASAPPPTAPDPGNQPPKTKEKPTTIQIGNQVPKKYEEVGGQNDLSFTIKSGTNDLDIDLKP